MKMENWFVFPRWMRRLLLPALLASLWPQTGSSSNFYQGVATNTLPWPGGIVPYVFDASVTTNEQPVYLAGMREWELAANIHFVARTTQANYVILVFDYMQGTNTYVASSPPVMTIDSLSRGQICHETGHLLGFQHEHVRTDRNANITVNFTNLIGSDSGTNSSGEGGSVAALYAIDNTSTLHGTYDFESVMHYGRTLFSIDPATLDVLVPNAPFFTEYYYRIGNLALSPGDRAGAAYLYGPPTTPIASVVTNTADAGLGSLRAAIYYANDHPGTTITFNIPTGDPGHSNGVYTIFTSGELPPLIANGTVIDATTQPGYVNHPVVAIDGSQLIPQIAYTGSFFISGLHIFAANCTIISLAVDNFPFVGINVEYALAISNRIEGCYIGIGSNGTNAAGNTFEGISIDTGASRTIVGGTNASQRNVISGNTEYGVLITGTNGLFGASVIGSNVDNNTIIGNYIGLNGTGTSGIGNMLSGIGIWGGASSNVIGGTVAGSRNVISGNTQYGVFVGDSNTVGTVFQGNYVGSDASGSVVVSNGLGGIGIFAGANHVTVGGTNTSAGNVLSGNGGAGLWLAGFGVTNNVVQGNYMGLNAAGTAAIANSITGLYVVGGSSSNLIGGTVTGAGNTFSGNLTYGIYISDPGTGSNLVQGNFIGTGPQGTNAIGNGFIGMRVWSNTVYNTIGGTSAAARNIISGNANMGLDLENPGTCFNLIQGNYIGVARDGITALPNAQLGIYLLGGPQSNTIGGTIAGAGNLISGNGGNGIQFFGPGTSFNLVEGNYVGVASNGTSALPNSGIGIYFVGASNNTVGGTTAGAGNLISGNGGDGIQFFGAGTSFNLVQGNYVGVSSNGITPMPNGGNGMYVAGASSNLFGGTTAGAGNVVAANAGDGIQIYDSSYNVVQGNLVGTDKTGLHALGNGGSAMSVYAGSTFNTVGGTSAAARNVLSGSTNYDGLYLSAASNNVVQGNYIGTDATGLHALGNGAFGYGLTLFGGSVGNEIAGNVIAASVNQGVFIADPGTMANLVQGNNIGVGADGVTSLGNGQQGIQIDGTASGNIIGLALDDSGAGNVIAHNTFGGIIVYDAGTIGNVIRGNSMFSNGDLAINLAGGTEDGFGVTANHVGGAVSGPNDLQNYPIITAAACISTLTAVSGTLNSSASHGFLVDVYRNSIADLSGHGQGQIYVGSTTLRTDGSGNGSFTLTANGNLAGQSFSVTATDEITGDTSEFSQDVTATNGPVPLLFTGPYTRNSSGFTFSLALHTNQNYTIQTATNLAANPVAWTTLSNFTATNSLMQFTDHSATNPAIRQRFYRAVTP